MTLTLLHGDSADVLPTLGQVGSVVTDPPYGLTFMGKKWDYEVPSTELWQAVIDVLRPGGHLVSFSGTRTYHRATVNIEDAGFDIRDMIVWTYGTGFPKSQDLGKVFDKAAGVEREVVGVDPRRVGRLVNQTGKYITDSGWSAGNRSADITLPATDLAKQWDGWGTGLKPALEPCVLARKPFKGTIAANVTAHGTRALNVGGCRVRTEALVYRTTSYRDTSTGEFSGQRRTNYTTGSKEVRGRFPANLIHDGSEEVTDLFGEASRFFYCTKASRKEKGEDNDHPTVKPLELMCYLCRLVTPPGGVVLDPFMGSGTTGLAAYEEGFNFIGIERDDHFFEIALKRLRDAGVEVATTL